MIARLRPAKYVLLLRLSAIYEAGIVYRFVFSICNQFIMLLQNIVDTTLHYVCMVIPTVYASLTFLRSLEVSTPTKR